MTVVEVSRGDKLTELLRRVTVAEVSRENKLTEADLCQIRVKMGQAP